MHARDCLTSGAAGPAWGGPREHRENALLDGNGALHQRRVAREAAEELERSAALQLRHRERDLGGLAAADQLGMGDDTRVRSEENTSELQSLMRNSYDVFCLTKKI